MSVKFAKKVLKTDDAIQWSVTRSVATTYEDMQTDKSSFVDFYRIMNDNITFIAMIAALMGEADRTTKEIMSASPTADVQEVGREAFVAALSGIFMAGVDMGCRVSAHALVDGFDKKDDTFQGKNSALAILEEMDNAAGRHNVIDEDEDMQSYMTRISKNVFMREAIKLGKQNNVAVPESVRTEAEAMGISVHADAPDAAPVKGVKSGHTATCGCRDHVMKTTTTEVLSGMAALHERGIPDALKEAISARAKSLGLNGVVGAAEVVSADGGHGLLTAELAKQPALTAPASILASNLAFMTTHGGSITNADMVKVAASFLASILTYAATDMMKTEETRH
jgi:hypothetical protein